MDVDYMNILENIRFDKADTPEAEGMALAIADNGLLQLVPLGDTYKEWVDNDNTDYAVQSSPEELLSVTITEDVPNGDGSVNFVASVDNYANGSGYLMMQLKLNGTVVDSESIRINELETAKFIGISRPFSCSAGDTISVWIYYQGVVNLHLRGDNIATQIKIKKLLTNALNWVATKPASSIYWGTKNDIYYDEPSGYIYLCTSTDHWVRWQIENSF
jgi:hypothetical protein